VELAERKKYPDGSLIPAKIDVGQRGGQESADFSGSLSVIPLFMTR
jgi:hypothetical protein